VSPRRAMLLLLLAACGWLTDAAPARADADRFGRLPTVPGRATGGGGCGTCADPANNIFEIEHVGSELWELSTTGTLYRTADCVRIETIAIQGFRGLSSGLAYDSRRDLLVVADLLLGQVLQVDFAGNVVNTFPAPTADMIGAAYDSTRDLYWFPDIATKQITSLSPATGLPGPAFQAPAGNNLAGCAYDRARDAIAYNARVQQLTYFVSAATGELIATLPMTPGGFNNGEGLSFAADGGVWIHNTDIQSVICTGNLDGVVGTARWSWGRLKSIYR
jgi:hypothetical protein